MPIRNPQSAIRNSSHQSLSVLAPASCDGCGLCCQGIGSPVLLYASRPGFEEPHPYRPADLPAELAAEIDAHFAGLTRGQEPQDQCLWYDAASQRCRHYEFRPQVCREYELGGRACLALRREHGF
jgi:Fe-S-cluster containining protein